MAYFAANLGRLSYITSMAEILRSEGMRNAAGGLISTGFFICYGAGQLVSGYLGDRFSPGWMVGFGLFFTGLFNLLMGMCATDRQMLIVWCLNGAVQSALWPPILRIIAEYFPPEYRKKACVYMAATYPAALLFSYGASAGMISLWSWRAFFFLYAVLLTAATAWWIIGFFRLSAFRTVQAAPDAKDESPAVSGPARLPWMVLSLFCAALIMQGMLRDGLMTWVPSYLSHTFQLDSAAAILSSAVLPIINLGGVYATSQLYRLFRNEATASLLLFALSAFATLFLMLWGHASIPLSLLCFSLVTASMMGINLLLVSFVPTYFAGLKKVSFLTGLTNAMVYIGSSLATYGIGTIADHFGWSTLLVVLIAVASIGCALCLAAIKPWKGFVPT